MLCSSTGMVLAISIMVDVGKFCSSASEETFRLQLDKFERGEDLERSQMGAKERCWIVEVQSQPCIKFAMSWLSSAKSRMAANFEIKKASPSTRTRANMTLRIPIDVRSIKGGFLKR